MNAQVTSVPYRKQADFSACFFILGRSISKYYLKLFEIVVRIEKRQAQPFDVTNGYTDVSNGTS